MKSRGAVLVEFAIVLPVFIFLVLGGLDLMRLENAKSDLDAIAITTASCFVQGTCADPQAFARSLASDFLMVPAKLTVDCSGNVCHVHYGWLPLSPFFSASTLNSSATKVP